MLAFFCEKGVGGSSWKEDHKQLGAKERRRVHRGASLKIWPPLCHNLPPRSRGQVVTGHTLALDSQQVSPEKSLASSRGKERSGSKFWSENRKTTARSPQQLPWFRAIEKTGKLAAQEAWALTKGHSEYTKPH